MVNTIKGHGQQRGTLEDNKFSSVRRPMTLQDLDAANDFQSVANV